MLITYLVEHLVALIENKNFDAAEAKLFITYECIESTWCCNNDVWMGVFVRKRFDVFLHWCSAVKDCCFDIWKIFTEPSVFVLDLVSQLASMAHHQDGALSSHRFDLLKSCEDENGGFPKARLGLAEYIGSQNGLRDADLLDCGKARSS